MNCICTIHTDYVDPSRKEEILQNVTRIITEALIAKDKEESYGEGKIHDR